MKSAQLTGPVRVNLKEVDTDYIVDPGLLLHLPIPNVLRTINPRRIMGRRWWNRCRKLVYASNDWHCQACGDYGEQVEAHEVYTFDLVNRVARFTDIVPLCHDCHMYIHWMATQGTERDNALKKGVGVLLRAGLKVPKIHVKTLQMESKVPEFLCEEVYTLELMSSLWHSRWKLDVTEVRRFRVRPQWLRYRLRKFGLMYLEEGDRCLVFPHRRFQGATGPYQ